MNETPRDQTVRGRGALCDLDDRNVIRRRLRDRANIMAPRRLTFLASAEHVAMMAISDEPSTFEQAIESDDHEQWEKAMDEEYESLAH